MLFKINLLQFWQGKKVVHFILFTPLCMGNLSILSTWDFDVQQDCFKLIMKSNAIQAMVKVDGKANLIIVYLFILLGQVIPQSQLIVTFKKNIQKVDRDCHGSCY